MSRGSGRRRRVARSNSNPGLPTSNSLLYHNPSRQFTDPKNYLRLVEDRRTWNPSGKARSARGFKKSHHTLIVDPNVNTNENRSFKPDLYSVPALLAFEDSKSTLVCVRRKIRKEVMFAKKKAGKKGQRRPRWNYYSKIKCRR